MPILHNTGFLILNTLLLFALGVTLIPLSPKMPAIGIDASWALGLNQATALSMQFGKQIIFTLGPYAAIYSKFYHPNLDSLIIKCTILITFCFWIAILELSKDKNFFNKLFLIVVLLSLIYSKDSLFLAYPFMIGFLALKYIKESPFNTQFIILLIPFGLLPLIKCSFLIACLIVLMFCIFLGIYNRNIKFIFISVLIPLFSLIFFWMVAGQLLKNLPYYYYHSIEFATYFSPAMALAGDPQELILYISSVLLLIFALVNIQYNDKPTLIITLSLVFIYLYLSFKAAFVRHYGHSFIASTSLLISLWFGFLSNKSKKLSSLHYFIILFILCSVYIINEKHTSVSIYKNIQSSSQSFIHGLLSRIQFSDRLQTNFNLSNEFINKQSNFPPIYENIDSYSYDQTQLLAAGYHWKPRPVFQSYSVFNANWAQLNKSYLLHKSAAQYLMFRVQPIDSRFPALEDGASWPVILSIYQPKFLQNEFLFLKRTTSNYTQPKFVKTSRLKYDFGEPILVPPLSHFIYAKIIIEPTYAGKIVNLIYKVNPLKITVTLNNGDNKVFRFIPNMARAGFLLSPLVENTSEFGLLYADEQYLKNKYVRSFSINSENYGFNLWNPNIKISFYTLETHLKI